MCCSLSHLDILFNRDQGQRTTRPGRGAKSVHFICLFNVTLTTAACCIRDFLQEQRSRPLVPIPLELTRRWTGSLNSHVRFAINSSIHCPCSMFHGDSRDEGSPGKCCKKMENSFLSSIAFCKFDNALTWLW